MYEKHIVCPKCQKTYDINRQIFRCTCGSTLEIIFDYKGIKKEINDSDFSERPFLHSKYREFFPVENIVSLQEGGTCLIKSKNIGKDLPFELYFKYEATNPTGSFKDRGSSVEIAKALEFKKNNVIVASTGNMGASVAAYSAAANIGCSIFTPKDVNGAKIEQMLAYGAKVYHFNQEYTEVEDAAEYVAKNFNVFLAGDYLYRREGTKSVGFEIAEQIDSDYVFIPIGNAVLLSAIWKGLNEFKIMGFIKKLPKLVGVQAHGSSTIAVDLFKTRKLKKLRHPHTLADAIEVGFPIDGQKALQALTDSKGFTETVYDKEILKARDLLARKEGLFAEPAGAASLAGLLNNKDKIERGSKVVCLVTGHGLKSPRIAASDRIIQVNKNAKLDKFFR